MLVLVSLFFMIKEVIKNLFETARYVCDKKGMIIINADRQAALKFNSTVKPKVTPSQLPTRAHDRNTVTHMKRIYFPLGIKKKGLKRIRM